MQHKPEHLVLVCVASQKIMVMNAERQLIFEASCSTAKNGLGQLFGSHCTPVGKHHIVAIAGINAPMATQFKARIPLTKAAEQLIHSDPITSRVFWLAGSEYGTNRGGDVDTKVRRIYIHGTTEVEALGTACSLGCVRVAPEVAIKLHQWVQLGTCVEIQAHHSFELKP